MITVVWLYWIATAIKLLLGVRKLHMNENKLEYSWQLITCLLISFIRYVHCILIKPNMYFWKGIHVNSRNKYMHTMEQFLTLIPFTSMDI